MSKAITIEDGRYEVGHGLGAWAKSEDSFTPLGSVRLIGGILMSAYHLERRSWFQEDLIWWTPVDESKNSYAELTKWVAGL